MKPWKGFTPVEQEKTGGGQADCEIDNGIFSLYDSLKLQDSIEDLFNP